MKKNAKTNIAIVAGSFLAMYCFATWMQHPAGNLFVTPTPIAIIAGVCCAAVMGHTMLKRSTQIKIEMTLLSIAMSGIGLFFLECVLVSAHIIQGPESIRHLVHASGPGSSTMNTLANLMFWGIGLGLTFGVAIPKLIIQDSLKLLRKAKEQERCNATV